MWVRATYSQYIFASKTDKTEKLLNSSGIQLSLESSTVSVSKSTKDSADSCSSSNLKILKNEAFGKQFVSVVEIFQVEC